MTALWCIIAVCPSRGASWMKVYRPGEVAGRSGEYRPVGPRGGVRHTEVTMVQGKRFPPLMDGCVGYVIWRPARNKSGYPQS